MSRASPDLWRALAVGCEAPDPAHRSVREVVELGLDRAEYTELFVHNLYPYAAVYVGEGGMLGGEAADRVAGFWRALGAEPPSEPDHLASLLGLYAELVEAEGAEGDEARSALLRRSRKALVWEHLLSWLPGWLAEAERTSAAYSGWARTLTDALRAEASELGPPTTLPLHLRAAPELPDADDADTMLTGFLTPVRSGMILTRRSLAGAARQIGAGLRLGERRFVLRALLGQDAEGTLAWLEREARRWQAVHETASEWTGDVGVFWADRARRTAEVLGGVRAERVSATR